MSQISPTYQFKHFQIPLAPKIFPGFYFVLGIFTERFKRKMSFFYIQTSSVNIYKTNIRHVNIMMS